MPLTDEQLREWKANLCNVPWGTWTRPPREEHKINRLIISGDGQTIAWVGHGSNPSAESIAAHIARCDPETIGGMIEEMLKARNDINMVDRIRAAALDEAAEKIEAEAQREGNDGAAYTMMKVAEFVLSLKTPELKPMSDEFPPNLIKRCTSKLVRTYGGEPEAEVRAVLRESGHAELVAALQEVQSKFPLNKALTAKTDAALRKAGVL